MENTKADKGMGQLHIQVHKDMLQKIKVLAAEQELRPSVYARMILAQHIKQQEKEG